MTGLSEDSKPTADFIFIMSVFKNQCFPPLKYKLDLLALGLAICLLKARNVPRKQKSAEPLWAVPDPSLLSCTEGPKQSFFFFFKADWAYQVAPGLLQERN